MKRSYLIVLLLVFVFIGSCSKKQDVLYVFNWTDYIDPELISEFEEANNCRIKLSTYDSNENMLTKIKNSNESFDIVFPSGDHVSIMSQNGLLEQLDKTLLSNYANLDKDLLGKAASFDDGNKYSIPYFWGLTGLIYNKRYVPEALASENSWAIIASSHFTDKNKITMLDDAREVVGAALMYSGYNLNDTSDEALAKALSVLKTWDKNITQFDSDSYKNEVQDGTTWLAQSYNGDALQLMNNNEELGFFLPKEGTSLWMDNIVILKSSRNKVLAHKFINFLLDAENAKRNAEYAQYASPNAAASKLISKDITSNSLIYPDAMYLQKCYMINFLGDEIKKIDRVFEEIKMF